MSAARFERALVYRCRDRHCGQWVAVMRSSQRVFDTWAEALACAIDLHRQHYQNELGC